jgi:hypothetical protein
MTTPQEKMQAFQSAQKFGKQYPGLLEALQEWAAIGSIDQAADEARRRLEALRAEERAVKDALEAKAADVDTRARKLIEDGERESSHKRAVAAALVDEARLEARCIVEAARAKAATIIEETEGRAADHEQQLAAAKLDLAATTARIDAKAGELASLSAAVEEKQAQHDRFAGLIADLKAKL